MDWDPGYGFQILAWLSATTGFWGRRREEFCIVLPDQDAADADQPYIGRHACELEASRLGSIATGIPM